MPGRATYNRVVLAAFTPCPLRQLASPSSIWDKVLVIGAEVLTKLLNWGRQGLLASVLGDGGGRDGVGGKSWTARIM